MSSTADPTAPQPVVLIHGMWMTPLSWEHWAARFEARGHQVLAPAWPGLEGRSRSCAATLRDRRARKAKRALT